MSVEVAAVAIPLLMVPVPMGVDPSKKVTVPVAFTGTVAVKVTDWLTVDGFSEEVRRTVGVVLLTI